MLNPETRREYGKTASGASYTHLSREQLIEEACKRDLAIATEAAQRGPLADYPIMRLDIQRHLEAHDRYLGLEPPAAPDARVAG
jgi:hypothetical protein